MSDLRRQTLRDGLAFHERRDDMRECVGVLLPIRRRRRDGEARMRHLLVQDVAGSEGVYGIVGVREDQRLLLDL